MNDASEPPENRPPRPGDDGDLPGDGELFVGDLGVSEPNRSFALRCKYARRTRRGCGVSPPPPPPKFSTKPSRDEAEGDMVEAAPSSGEARPRDGCSSFMIFLSGRGVPADGRGVPADGRGVPL